MDNQQRILELQRKIDQLSSTLEGYQHELALLRQELNLLQNKSIVSADNAETTDVSDKSQVHSGFENFIGLRFMHIAGIVVLVTGLSIGVKYAIDKELISETLRILLAYGAGIVLFLLSLRLKHKYLLFSAILFSGSMASLYFTSYAASVYYNFFPPAIAFVIMTVLTIYTVIMAIGYNRQEIAVLGMVGAYGIPFLVSNNSERTDLFFSYILLINAGVAFISFRKSWKLMQYMALLITWILFIGWSFMRFDPKDRWLGFAFMSAYYVLFLLGALARHIRLSSPLLPGEIQQILINNVALYIAALLLFSNGGFELNLAPVTGVLALFISVMALAVAFLLPSEIILQRLLAWQAIIMVVLYIGVQWENLTVTLLWIVVAILLFGWGIFNKKSWPRLASILLIAVTLGKLIIFDSSSFSTVQKIISFLVIGILLLFFSFYYQRFNLLNKKKE